MQQRSKANDVAAIGLDLGDRWSQVAVILRDGRVARERLLHGGNDLPFRDQRHDEETDDGVERQRGRHPETPVARESAQAWGACRE